MHLLCRFNKALQREIQAEPGPRRSNYGFSTKHVIEKAAPANNMPLAPPRFSVYLPAVRSLIGMRPRGGVVTQRTANPCTPVRFRARPPNLLTTRCCLPGSRHPAACAQLAFARVARFGRQVICASAALPVGPATAPADPAAASRTPEWEGNRVCRRQSGLFQVRFSTAPGAAAAKASIRCGFRPAPHEN